MRLGSLLLAMTFVVLASAGLARAEDREIAEQIAGMLQASGQLRDYNIRVKVENGTAWLRGRVASDRQMNAAAAIVLQAEGIKEVVNGLTVWTGPEPRPGMAPIASRRPMDFTNEQLRLAPPSFAPAPIVAAPPALEHSVPELPPGPQLAPTIRIVDQTAALPTSTPPEPSSLSEPVRSLEFSTSLEVLPCTVQKACHWSPTGRMHAMDPDMVATLTGAAELMLLPEDCGVSAGEAFASDASDSPPVLLDPTGEAFASDDAEGPPLLVDTTGEDRSLPDTSAANPSTQSSLIQPLPEPTRRTWEGTFRPRGIPTAQAVIENQP